MLFTFRSKTSAEFYMLEPHAKRLLELIGKPASPTGIVTAAQTGDALRALEQAIAQTQAPAAEDADEPRPAMQRDVGLAQRAWPLLDMLRKAHARQTDVTWEAR